MTKGKWKQKAIDAAERRFKIQKPYIEVCISGVNDKVTSVKKKNGVYGWRSIDADDPGGIGEGSL